MTRAIAFAILALLPACVTCDSEVKHNVVATVVATAHEADQTQRVERVEAGPVDTVTVVEDFTGDPSPILADAGDAAPTAAPALPVRQRLVRRTTTTEHRAPVVATAEQGTQRVVDTGVKTAVTENTSKTFHGDVGPGWGFWLLIGSLVLLALALVLKFRAPLLKLFGL